MKRNPYDGKFHFQINPPEKVDFPLHIFPEDIQRLIYDIDQESDIYPEFQAGIILSAFSGAIGNRFDINVTRYWRNVKMITWTAIVGEPSAKKSPPMKILLDIFRKLDDQNDRDHKRELSRYLDTPERERKASDEPIAKRFSFNQATLEGLMKLLSGNPQGLLMKQDELISWIDGMGKYNKDKNGEMAQWLSLYNGESVDIIRSGPSGRRVSEPFCSVIGGIQPRVLNRLASGNEGNGFTTRIDFIYPDFRKPLPTVLTSTGPQGSPPELLAYEATIEQLTSMVGGKSLVFDSQASLAFNQWSKLNTAAIATLRDGDLAQIYGKLQGRLVRYAGIIHIMRAMYDLEPDLQSISATSIEHAISLIEYFRYTSVKVHAQFATKDETVSKIFELKKKGKKVEEIAEEMGVTKRTIYRKLKEFSYLDSGS